MLSTLPALVGVGALYIDTLLNVPHYPAEDSKLRATHLTKRRGGNVPNTLAVLAQLLPAPSPSPSPSPSPLRLIAVLPARSSPATAFIDASFAGAVDLGGCVHRDEALEAASSYVLRSAATGSRTVVNFNPLGEMTPGEFAAGTGRAGAGAGWWHFEGRIPDVTLECVRWLRADPRTRAARVSVEVEKPGREGLQALAAEADVVFYSKSWAKHEGYDDPEAFLRWQASKCSRPRQLLFVTLGEEGAAAFDVERAEYIHRPAQLGGREVVDSVGAGDTFIAGMLYGLLYRPEWSVAEKLAWANRLAGWKVCQEGFDGLGQRMQDEGAL